MHPLTFYIVFHKELYERNTKSFTQEELQTYFTWIGVNEKIPKVIPLWLSHLPILYEYKMEHHCPLYQMLNFYQNSVFFHLYHNKSLLKSKYIGFGQYDMSIDAGVMRQIIQNIQTSTHRTLYGFFLYPSISLFNLLNENDWNDIFFNPYFEQRGLQHTYQSIQHLPLALLHTFIIPQNIFIDMMGFVEKIYPLILKKLNWDTAHLAGTLERVFALFLNCQIKEDTLQVFMNVNGIQHIDDQHSEDTLRGIASGKEAFEQK